MRLCPNWSLALASSVPVLGLERFCPRKGCPWPWPRIFLCPWLWPRALCPRLHLCTSLLVINICLPTYGKIKTNCFQKMNDYDETEAFSEFRSGFLCSIIEVSLINNFRQWSNLAKMIGILKRTK